jgi:hypothetical protein
MQPEISGLRHARLLHLLPKPPDASCHAGTGFLSAGAADP